MKQIYTHFRDQFGTYYQIIASGFESPHAEAERRNFSCPEFTLRFLRNLYVPVNFWHKFLIQKNLGNASRNLTDHEALNLVVNLLISGSVEVHQFPELSKKAIRNNAGSAYRFFKGPDPYPCDLSPINFLNENEATKLIKSLNIPNAKSWYDSLKAIDVLPVGINPDKTAVEDYQLIAMKLVLSRELLVYQTKDSFIPPGSNGVDQLESTQNVPGNRPAHMTPPPSPSPKGPAHIVDANKVKTDQEESCEELDKCEVNDKQKAADEMGMRPDDLEAITNVCEEKNAIISFRQTNKACLKRFDEGLKSKSLDIKKKTFIAECLPDSHKELAGLVSNLDKMPTDGTVLSGNDLIPYTDAYGSYLTGDYDMHDMIDATTGERIVGESKRDKKLREKMNDEIDGPDRIKHGAQANYMDYCKKEKVNPNTELLQPDPPVTVIDGKPPATIYRIEDDVQLLNMYNCKGTEVPESWNFQARN